MRHINKKLEYQYNTSDKYRLITAPLVLSKAFDYVLDTFITVSQNCSGSCTKLYVFILREWNFEDWCQISIWWQTNNVLLREFSSSIIFWKPHQQNIKFTLNMSWESPHNWQNIDVTISLFIRQSVSRTDLIPFLQNSFTKFYALIVTDFLNKETRFCFRCCCPWL